VQNLAQYIDPHVFDRKADQVHRGYRLAAHRIYIAERVSSRDLPEHVGGVHDRREEIYGLDDGQIVGQLIDTGVVGPVNPDNQVGVGIELYPAERVVQVPWTEL
jgi:hypothetical protein